MPPDTPLVVDRLIGGDRVQPGTQFPLGLELVALQVHLEERQLEHFVGHFGVAEVIPQVSEQLFFVTVDQFFEDLAVGAPCGNSPEESFSSLHDRSGSGWEADRGRSSKVPFIMVRLPVAKMLFQPVLRPRPMAAA